MSDPDRKTPGVAKMLEAHCVSLHKALKKQRAKGGNAV
jgi:hypothetical protein